MLITLSPEEVQLAKWIWIRRDRIDREKGIKDRAVIRRFDAWHYAAELAVAKALNIYPDFNTDPVKIRDADLLLNGLRVDVKWTARQAISIRKKSRIVDIYVAVTGQFPTFTIHGFIGTGDAKSDRFWDPEARVPCWKVPLDCLLPMGMIVQGAMVQGQLHVQGKPGS